MSTLPTRKLGKLTSSALGLGCMSLTDGFYGEGVDEVETAKTLRKALDSGVTLLNTADFYTSMTSGKTSQNIKLIGKTMKDYPREKVIIAMKWGCWIEGGFKEEYDVSPEGCRQRVENALKCLGTDYIDILVFRKMPFPDIHNTSMEDLARGMKAMVDVGKVKAVGLSECTVEDIQKIHSIVPVSVFELEWSLFSREQEEDVIPLARRLGAGIMAYA